MASPDESDPVERLWRRVVALGGEAAVWESGREVSYKEFADRIERAEAELTIAGIPASDVVGIEAEFGATAISRLFAILRRRGIAALLNGGAMAAEGRLHDACAEWTWPANGGLRKVVDARRHVLLDRLRRQRRAGLVFFSGGTSGRPKAVLHDANALLQPMVAGGAGRYRLVSMMPMAHIGGFDALLRVIAAGATLIVPRGRDPVAVAEAVELGQADVLVTTPSFLNLMRLALPNFEQLGTRFRVVAYGAESMSSGLLARLRECWPRTEFRPRFGTSETGAVVVHRRNADATEFMIDPASADYRVEDGELWLRNPGRMLGYLNASAEEVRDDGWFATGDIVEELTDGFLRVNGRRSALVNVGGNKVHPEEVERGLWGIEGVVALRAAGERHAIMGEVIVIDVVATAGASPAEVRARIRATAAERLPAFQRPAAIRFVAELANTEGGKLARA